MSVYFVANILICNDQEYQFYLDCSEEILKYRLAASECDTILIQGK